jgi:hypothetical protein
MHSLDLPFHSQELRLTKFQESQQEILDWWPWLSNAYFMYSSSCHDCQTCLLLPGCELLTVNCKKWKWSAFLNLGRLCLCRYDSFDQGDLYRADVEFLNCLKSIPESSRKNLAGTYRNVYMLGKCWNPLDLSSHSFMRIILHPTWGYTHSWMFCAVWYITWWDGSHDPFHSRLKQMSNDVFQMHISWFQSY